MTLASSGYISLADNPSNRAYPNNRVVNIELSKSANATISHPSSETRNLTGVGSGALRLPDDYWNKTATFSFNLPAGANINFRTAAINAGWNQSSYVIGTLPSSNVITSGGTGSAGLTISGSFPNGVKFINQSIVYGAGGNGGDGGGGSPPNNSGTNGGNGGTALYVSVACQVDNALGELRGGGGGGGGGGGYDDSKLGGGSPAHDYGGGGGGGGGYNGGTGGIGASYGANGTNGGGGGAGGNGSYAGGNGYVGYRGGNGGAQGAAGQAGSNLVGGNCPPGNGGAAGSATQGSASYITWVGAGYGIRIGPVN